MLTIVNRSQDAPNYRPGLYACLACAVMNIILVGILSLNFRRLNGQADRGEKELEDSDVSEPEKVSRRDNPTFEVVKLTCLQEDYQPGFRYTL